MDVAPQSSAHGLSASDSTRPPAGKRDRACERCWRRKQKCDRTLPACTACTALGLQCQERRSDQDPDTLEDGGALTASSLPKYIETLKRKVGQMEDAQTPAKRRRTCSPLNTEHDTTSENVANSRTTTTAGTGENPAEGSVHATLGQIGFLSRSAMAEPRDGEGTREPHCHLAPEKMVKAAATLSSPTSHLPGFAALISLGSSVQPLTLTRESTVSFMHRFLEEAPTLFLVHLNRDQWMAQYESVIAEHANGRSTGSATSHPLRDFSIYMSLAIGAAMAPESSRLESFSAALHAASIDIFPSVIKTCSSAAYLHCLLYLIVYSTLNSHGGSTWYLLGLATSKCISSGLHRHSTVNDGLPDLGVNSAKYIFWSLYLLDRCLASIMDRPFAIQDYDISVQDPEESSDGHESLIFQLVMHSKLISYFRSSSDQSDVHNYHNFLYWQQLSPPVRHLVATSPGKSKLLHRLAFRTLAELVQSLADSDTCMMAQGFRTLEKDAMAHCRILIDEIHEELDQGSFSGSLLDGFDVFTAGILILHLSILLPADGLQPKIGLQASKSVTKCCNILTALGERLSQFRSYRKILFSIYNHLVDGSSAQPNLELPAATPGRLQRIIEKLLGPSDKSTELKNHGS